METCRKISLDKVTEILKTSSTLSLAHKRFCEFYNIKMCLGSFRNMLINNHLLQPKKRIKIHFEK